MGHNPTQSDREPLLQDVASALVDPDCRAILRETTEPMTAMELSKICDIPKSTLYRKLDLLSTASLVREVYVIHPEGGRTTSYERDFDDVTISVEENEKFSVKIKRPARDANERLADMWSKMGDELSR